MMKRKSERVVPDEQPYEEIQLRGYYRNYAFESDGEDHDEIDYHHSNVSTNSPLISLNNVYFRYRKKQEWILNCLQMNIPQQCIYSLLGSTRSGKTTLIKLIIGLLRPTSGQIEIKIFDNQIDSHLPFVGYMPKELALYENLTIGQLLTYFGRLYLMSGDEIKLRIKQLTCQLKFSRVDQRSIGELTESEKHCVSLACSIIHNPIILVCDEPTASLCPEIKQTIWNHLTELVRQHHSTILITTCHFEEARRFSNLVGFLRNGKLMAEKSPDTLLTTYNSTSLDHVYMRLCRLEKLKSKSTMDPVFLQIKQVVDSRFNLEEQASKPPDNNSINHHHSSKRSFIHLNNSSVNKQLDSIRPNLAWLIVFSTLLHNNFVASLRSPGRIALQFGVPIYQLILFYLAFGRDPFNLSIGIVNEDRQPSIYSRQFIETIDSYFINQINYTTLNDAIRDIKHGKLVSVMHIGDQFSNLINERFQLNDNLTRNSIERSNIFLHSDLTNKFITSIVDRSLVNSFQLFSERLLQQKSKPGYVHYPIRYADAIYGPQRREHQIWKEYTISGLIVNISFSMSLCFTCFHFINERKCAMLEKQFMAKCSPTQIILAYTVCQLVFAFVQISLMLFLGIELFNLKIACSYSLIICLIELVNISGILIGICLSSFFKPRTYTLITISFALFFNQLLISGTLWPFETYSKWLRYSSVLLNPTTLPSQNLNNLLFRCSATSRSGFLCCFIWSCLFGYLSIKKFKFINL